MNKENFTSISLQEEMQRSYLEYAMSVIVGRALPDARDGLKPVQEEFFCNARIRSYTRQTI